jgi:acyl carrier protein
MANEIILEKVQTIIAGALDLVRSEISLEKSFRHDLKADSLDSVEIIMAIEDEFGVQFDEDTASSIDTVGQLIEAIERVQASERHVTA